MLLVYGKQIVQIGYAPTSGMCYPEKETPKDIEAARKALFALPDDLSNWTWNVSWWSDPVILGKYPEEGMKKYEKYLPVITDEDMKLISQPIDFYGQNIYNGRCIRMGPDGRPEEVRRPAGFPKTATNWPVTPEALYWGPKFYEERYHKKLYITENGLSNQDWIFLDGQVHDLQRIDFLHRYLYQLKRAVEEGISVEGYFHWTLTDNFEWTSGYNNRFGLVYTDFKNQNRIIKDSGKWYRQVIETNGEIIK